MGDVARDNFSGELGMGSQMSEWKACSKEGENGRCGHEGFKHRLVFKKS